MKKIGKIIALTLLLSIRVSSHVTSSVFAVGDAIGASPKTLYDLNRNFQIHRMSSKFTSTLSTEGVHLVSVFFYTGCFNILLEWLKHDLHMTPKEVAALMVRLDAENFVE